MRVSSGTSWRLPSDRLQFALLTTTPDDHVNLMSDYKSSKLLVQKKASSWKFDRGHAIHEEQLTVLYHL
jgi:hypothetical protein